MTPIQLQRTQCPAGCPSDEIERVAECAQQFGKHDPIERLGGVQDGVH